ncbi:MAG: glycoside hydrolase family 13 protein [Gracilimonas sp.]|uniref:glycoside hydrolase family 13 protein n=1 Tax=Gracilimonas sp. TaxID=1974203 RepID=UPI0019C01D4F|nr:glycoside hydrolase family 13 protein [Gracilimonas sp.]MBD3617242.1 glycoside hydrolase family 13 protein [Gracilimonas sp.]
MKKLFSLTLALFLLAPVLQAQTPEEIQVIDPPFWWTEMPVNELQLQLYGDNLGLYRASTDHPGVKITKQLAVDSPNYLFLYFDISDEAEAGEMEIVLIHHNKEIVFNYELKTRESMKGRNNGFDPSDVIYLMMPDRFANGDPSNDTVEGMIESADRSDPRRRQGGDIQGVMDHLDYIEDLGMTAIWFTPMFENDMSVEYGAYHGYAATDLYKVDRRFGSNELYKELVSKVQERNMKVIMDMIHNHIGDNHWWMDDLPTNDWVFDYEEVGQTNYRGVTASDPYASKYDSVKLTSGWFVPEMPDLNQNNELLADYLIQNTLWWIEYSGVDGIRMDTYVYPDKDYMARWAKEVLEAYPDFNIVGESWVENVPAEAYWQYDKAGVDDGYQSHLPSLTDFQFAFAARDAFNEEFGWTTGLSQLYYVLSQDFLYSDPMGNIIFLDNHDMSRYFEHIGKDEDYFKMAYAFLMTTRGIPQVYYGTELMMEHEYRGGDDEAWRQTMPGGWPDDDRSVFTEEGRTDKENEIMEYVTKLTQWRKNAIATHEGKLVHFIPENNTYVYFRVHEDQTIMVAMNANEEAVSLDRNRFAEILDDFEIGIDVISDEQIDVSDDIEVPGKIAVIWELK